MKRKERCGRKEEMWQERNMKKGRKVKNMERGGGEKEYGGIRRNCKMGGQGANEVKRKESEEYGKCGMIERKKGMWKVDRKGGRKDK